MHDPCFHRHIGKHRRFKEKARTVEPFPTCEHFRAQDDSIGNQRFHFFQLADIRQRPYLGVFCHPIADNQLLRRTHKAFDKLCVNTSLNKKTG
ncbi:hypothetical protein D3C78_1688490 [compost metagenome]